MLELLGQGGESRVYAFGRAHVLRVLRAGTGADRRALVDSFDHDAVSFAVPRAVVTGPGWTIEERVPGRSLDWWMQRLDGADERRRAFLSYSRAVSEVVRLHGRYDFFGELCGPLRTPAWPDYLRAKVHEVLRVSGDWLRADVDGFDHVLARFLDDCALVGDVTVPRLVHGDYFPGNVVTGDDLELTGVIDFGILTLAGDPRMDLAGALWFLDCAPGFRSSDFDVVADVVRPLVDDAVLDLYRRYYALFFSSARPDDAELYAWCVGHLASAP